VVFQGIFGNDSVAGLVLVENPAIRIVNETPEKGNKKNYEQRKVDFFHLGNDSKLELI